MSYNIYAAKYAGDSKGDGGVVVESHNRGGSARTERHKLTALEEWGFPELKGSGGKSTLHDRAGMRGVIGDA